MEYKKNGHLLHRFFRAGAMMFIVAGLSFIAQPAHAFISDVNNINTTGSVQVQIYTGNNGSGGFFQGVDPGQEAVRLGSPRGMTNFATWYHSVTTFYPTDGQYMVCVYIVGASGNPADCDVNGGANSSANFTWTGGIATQVPLYQDTHINSVIPHWNESTTSPFTIKLNFYNGTTTPEANITYYLRDRSVGTYPGVLWRTGSASQIFDPGFTYDLSFPPITGYPKGIWFLTASLFDVNGNIIDSTTTPFSISSDSTGLNNYDPGSAYSSTTDYINIPDFVGSTVGTSTVIDTTNFLSFLNVPNLLKTKVPFAYLFQIGSTLISAVSSSSAFNIPLAVLNINFPIPNRPTTTISVDLFSTTTITHFLTPTYISLLRGLMVAVTYVSMGMYIFHDARHKRHLI